MKKLMLIIVLICGGLLTGCVHLTDLTDKESDMLSEYMAGTVLKYDANYENALDYPNESLEVTNTVSDDIQESNTEDSQESSDIIDSDTYDNSDADELINSIESKDTIEPDTIKNNSNSEVSSDTEVTSNTSDSSLKEVSAQYASIEKEVGNGNFAISYVSFDLYSSYPSLSENNFYSFSTGDDRELLVLTFNIKNLSDKNQNINLLDSGLSYQLNVNSGTTYKPMIPLLLNDIQYMNLDIAAGKTKKAVLVFDVLREDIKAISLFVSKQDKTAEIKIK